MNSNDQGAFWHPSIAPDAQPYKVAIRRGLLHDDARAGRAVPYKLYCPQDPGLKDVPLVVWSHGLGGSADGAGFLARYVAANGYVVLHVQHPGTDTSLWEGQPGHPWDVIRKAEISRQVTLDRFYDVPFVLDHLPVLAERHPELACADFSRLGMAGHSFGALTTQVMAGQLFPNDHDELISLAEPRFSAGILYSFVPMGHLTDAPPEKLYGAMDRPLLFMTGTADDSPVSGYDYTYRLPVYEHAGGDEKTLLVLDEGDHMVFAGSRGKLAAHPKREQHEAIIKIGSLAFWDSFLKNDQAARDWLAGGGLSRWARDDAQLQGPWIEGNF